MKNMELNKLSQNSCNTTEEPRSVNVLLSSTDTHFMQGYFDVFSSFCALVWAEREPTPQTWDRVFVLQVPS